MTKSKRILLIILAMAAILAFSGCEQQAGPSVTAPPASFPFMYLQHPMGTIGVGMTLDEIEEILGMEPEFFVALEGAYLADYEIPDIVVIYDEFDRAVMIRSFSYGTAYNGVTIGMYYDVVVAIVGENAFESFVPERDVFAVALFYDENGEQTSPFDPDAAYSVTFEIGDEGLVERLEIEMLL